VVNTFRGAVFCEHKFTRLNRGFADASYEEQLTNASQIVKRHYMESKGEIKFHGGIKEYRYWRRYGSYSVFDIEGKLVKKDS